MKSKRILIPLCVFASVLVLIVIVIIIVNNKHASTTRGTFEECLADVDEVKEGKYTNLDFSECSLEPLKNISSKKINIFFSEYDDKLKMSDAEAKELKRKIDNIGLKVLEADLSSLDYKIKEAGYGIENREDPNYFIDLNRDKTIIIIDEKNYIYPYIQGGDDYCISATPYRIDENVDISDVKDTEMPMTLKEAVEKCTALTEGDLAEFGMCGSFIPKTAFILRTETGRVAYLIRFLHAHDGIGITDIDNGGNATYGMIQANWMDIEIGQNGKVTGIRSPYLTAYKEDKETEDSFIKLSDAAKILSDFLAPYGEYGISSVTINYCALNYIDETGAFVNQTPEHRPMWCFVTNRTKDRDYFDIDPRLAFFVDMISGDVYPIDTVNNRKWFSINPDRPLK